MKYLDISRNKVELMGVAMLLVMFFHAQVRIDNSILYYIHYYGYIGVDLFLFLSGIGCLYSYRKNSDKKQFFKKRIFRLLPVYLPIAIVLSFLLLKFNYITVSDFLGESTLTNFIFQIGNFPKWYWYIPSLLFMYFLTPFVIDFYDKYKNKRKAIVVIWFVSFLLGLLAMGYNNACYYIFVGRIPIYLIGLYFGQKALNEDKMSKGSIIFLFIMSLLSILFLVWNRNFGVRWWSNLFIYLAFIFLTVFLSILISYIINYLRDHFKFIKFSFLKFIGTITLEIYSMHERLIIIGFFIFKKLGYTVSIYGMKYNIFIAFVTIFMAYIYNKVIKWMMDYKK